MYGPSVSQLDLFGGSDLWFLCVRHASVGAVLLLTINEGTYSLGTRHSELQIGRIA